MALRNIGILTVPLYQYTENIPLLERGVRVLALAYHSFFWDWEEFWVSHALSSDKEYIPGILGACVWQLGLCMLQVLLELGGCEQVQVTSLLPKEALQVFSTLPFLGKSSTWCVQWWPVLWIEIYYQSCQEGLVNSLIISGSFFWPVF